MAQSIHIQPKALLTDLNGSTTSATSPVASLSGVGDYSGVDLNAFSVLGDELTGGIASQSPANRAASQPVHHRLRGNTESRRLTEW